MQLIEIIGKGNYGNVYRAKLTANNEVTAVKVVELKEEELRETLLEMEILAGTRHVNVTRFMGMYLKNLDLWVSMRAKRSMLAKRSGAERSGATAVSLLP